MLKTLRNAWKIKEIRTKLIFTFLMLVVIRFGSELPIPGVKTDFFANFFANQSTDAFGFFNAMTGGSFSSMSLFALSITPYITSSIIMQLLTIAIPKLEEMQRDGEDRRVHPLLNGCTCTDRVHRYGSRFRRPGTSDQLQCMERGYCSRYHDCRKRIPDVDR